MTADGEGEATMKMLLRTMAGPLALALGTGLAEAREWRFRVYLDDREIGEHSFVLEEGQGVRRLASRASFDVGFLFFNVYSYRHRADEVWEGDCLIRIDAATEDGGERFRVAGARRDGAFVVDSGEGTERLPSCIMSFAYWNPAMLEQNRLLNAQTGEYLEVAIDPQGQDTLTFGDRPVPARRYALTAEDIRITLWYGEAGDWLALESVTPEGYAIRYRPL